MIATFFELFWKTKKRVELQYYDVRVWIIRHKDKRMVLAHMAKHTRRDNFSCGLCGKGSNWQSVIRVFYLLGVSRPVQQQNKQIGEPRN